MSNTPNLPLAPFPPKFRFRNPATIILSAYGPHRRIGISFPVDEDRTKQSFKDECDINVIMKRYEQSGILPERRDARNAVFADVTGHDFNNAMNILADARSAFEELPASVRDRFSNDPAELLAFVHDEANREEAAELGLLDLGDGAEPRISKEAGGSLDEPGARKTTPAPAKPGGAGGGQAPRGGRKEAPAEPTE